MSHGWLLSQEDDKESDVFYLVADVNGSSCGALPVYIPRRESNALYRGDALLPQCVGLPSQPAKLAILGNRRGYRAGAVLSPGLSMHARNTVLSAILDHAIAECQRLGRVAIMPYVPEYDRALLGMAGCGAGLPITSEAAIEVSGADEEGWLGRLSGGRRQMIRRERRIFAKAGWTVSVEPLSEVLDPASRLLAKLQRRHGQLATADSVRRLLARQEDVLHHQGVAFVARRASEIGGVALGYVYKKRLYLRAIGYQEDSRSDRIYPNLFCYAPVSYALANGLHGVHLGILSLHAKLMRGAELSPLWCLPAGWEIPEPTRKIAHEIIMKRISAEVGE